MSEQAPEPNGSEEQWVYLGESLGIAGAYRWRDAAGETMTFKGAKARVPGGIYTVRVGRGESVSLYGRDYPYTGRMAEDAATIQLEAQTVEHHLKAKRLNANTSRTGAIDEALAPVLALAKTLKTYADRRALVEYLNAQIYATH